MKWRSTRDRDMYVERTTIGMIDPGDRLKSPPATRRYPGMGRITTCLVAFWGFGALAQNTGTLRLMIDPGHNFEVVVDKKHRMQQREIKLAEGLHQFSVWAPERMVVDTAVFIVADRSSDLVMRLPYSPEFVAYRGELAKWQTKRRVERTLPILATAGGLVWSVAALSRYGKARDVLEKDREQYEIEVDPSSIARLKGTTIPAHNADLRNARQGVYVAAGVTALCGAATWYLVRRSLGRERPVFEDEQKVIFDGLVWLPSRSGSFVHAGITIPLHP